MLDANVKTQVQRYFTNLVEVVEIRATLDDSKSAQDMQQLLGEIAELSDRITINIDPLTGSERAPSFSVSRHGETPRIAFAGVPMGHEFTSLVLAILQTGGHPAKISDDTIAQIRALDGDYVFETFISLSCQICPDVIQALNVMAVINPRIHHTMIDGALFQEEVKARNILSVPSVFMNGELFAQGRITLEEIIAKLDSNSATKAAEKLQQKDAFDVLVVGGGPAGSAAAIYAARKGIRTGVVAERFGGQVLDTMAIENFISVKETEGPKMAAALEQHVKAYDVDIINLQRADKLIPADQSASGLIEINLASGATLKSKAVIVSTGARWREMNVPGEREYRGRGVAYCPHCDGPLFKGKRVAVIGGGNSGVEAAIDLAGIVSHVTVLEFDSQLRADAVLQQKLSSLANVTVIKSAQTTAVTGDGQRVNGIDYKDRNSGAEHHIELEGIFVQIGLMPNSDWLKDTIELSPRGEIVVDTRGQTSVPGVFAAGDVTTVPFKQIIIAMGEGAKAALGAFDHLIRST